MTVLTSRTRPFLFCAALALAGCGGGIADSWVNPGNWFGQSRGQAIDASGPVNPLIPKRRLGQRAPVEYSGNAVDQIKSLRIERKPGGAIINVVGVTDAIGYYDVRLRAENDNKPVKGVLTYTLSAERPADLLNGTEASRQVVAARFVSDQQLEGVRTIVVQGARNQRSTRRR